MSLELTIGAFCSVVTLHCLVVTYTEIQLCHSISHTILVHETILGGADFIYTVGFCAILVVNFSND